jgi:hypothetical protein
MKGDYGMKERQPLAGTPKVLQRGRMGWILLWLLGVPIPVLLILFVVRGCT